MTHFEYPNLLRIQLVQIFDALLSLFHAQHFRSCNYDFKKKSHFRTSKNLLTENVLREVVKLLSSRIIIPPITECRSHHHNKNSNFCLPPKCGNHLTTFKIKKVKNLLQSTCYYATIILFLPRVSSAENFYLSSQAF